MSKDVKLRLRGLEKIYDGSVRAVDGVDLDIKDGEFVTLVGPSGCGKSTTLRMLAGFVSPTAGTIEMDGVDITAHQPDERDIGMVFQSIALFPHLTVKENIAYGMRVANESFSEEEVDERVAEMLEIIEMPGYKDRYPDQLSGGQQQRIGLARALALEPEVLLLDEPLSALDEKLREHMQAELSRIQKDLGVTTIFVTHNQEEAMTMSDRIVVMDDGRFAQVGSPAEVYDKPDSVFVGDFMGKSNQFTGTRREIDDSKLPVVETALGTFDVDSDSIAPGKDVTLLIRPEDMTITRAGDGTGNVVSGTVDLVQHLGSAIEYHVETADGSNLVASEPSTGGRAFKRGDDVDMSFEPDDCRLFSSASAANGDSPSGGAHS